MPYNLSRPIFKGIINLLVRPIVIICRYKGPLWLGKRVLECTSVQHVCRLTTVETLIACTYSKHTRWARE